jgi:hypothetical protein
MAEAPVTDELWASVAPPLPRTSTLWSQKIELKGAVILARPSRRSRHDLSSMFYEDNHFGIFSVTSDARPARGPLGKPRSRLMADEVVSF